MDESSLTDEQYYVLDQFKEGNNLFITGPGGVGKSHLINTLVHYCNSVNKPVQVCALTGCAAVLLGGKTKTDSEKRREAIPHKVLLSKESFNKYSK